MDDGFFVPGLCDGMGAFQGRGRHVVLIRNHELSPSTGLPPFGPNNELAGRIAPCLLYDAGTGTAPSPGCTTTLIYSMRRRRVTSQFLSLGGTLRNCGGGITPWGTWITCEETTQRATGAFAKDHGYCFEVTTARFPARPAPEPLRAMGRFLHESVAVHPESGITYQTEDRSDGLIYRFVPDVPGQLAAGGQLQALRILDLPDADARNWGEVPSVPVGLPLEADWIDLDDVESPNDDLRRRGHAAGAALFARGEGMTYGNGSVYFVCTTGGLLQKGQVWKYTPSPYEGTTEESAHPGVLELFLEPNDETVLDMGDNITVAPWGDLLVCEDGARDQFLVGITPAGETYKMARNALSYSELAGPTFSPDGAVLFLNILGQGITFAVAGPWDAPRR
jgi:hypothetical protein